MKLDTYNNKKTTASDTIKEQRDEITLLKAKLAEKEHIIAEMVKAEEQDADNKHQASIRTSFVLPNDWTDLEKLWLAFKVINADNSVFKQDTFDERDDVFDTLWNALLQAVLIAPARTHEDILIKLEALDFNLTAHLKDNKGNIKLSCVNWLELEAHAINKQLKDLLTRLLLPEQKERLLYIEEKNKRFEDNLSKLTEQEKRDICDNLKGKGTKRIEDLYND